MNTRVPIQSNMDKLTAGIRAFQLNCFSLALIDWLIIVMLAQIENGEAEQTNTRISYGQSTSTVRMLGASC